MKMLLLGYSDISRRRIMPALLKCGVHQIDIASQSRAPVEWPEGLSGRCFRSYEEALSDSDADLVYISTVNSLHACWARRALELGFHVVVDKPIALSLEETLELLKLAERQRRCLAEVVSYGYHPQVARALRIFEEHRVSPSRLVASFSFPPLAGNNFRYRSDLGGGALWDLAPYAASMGRIFFREGATEIVAQCASAGDGVEVSFDIMARYPSGGTSVGVFGFTTGYINRLEVLGDGIVVTIDRAFTPPRHIALDLAVNISNKFSRITIDAADSFSLFFQHLFRAIEERSSTEFAQRIESDARAIALLRTSALQNISRRPPGESH